MTLIMSRSLTPFSEGNLLSRISEFQDFRISEFQEQRTYLSIIQDNAKTSELLFCYNRNFKILLIWGFYSFLCATGFRLYPESIAEILQLAQINAALTHLDKSGNRWCIQRWNKNINAFVTS